MSKDNHNRFEYSLETWDLDSLKDYWLLEDDEISEDAGSPDDLYIDDLWLEVE